MNVHYVIYFFFQLTFEVPAWAKGLLAYGRPSGPRETNCDASGGILVMHQRLG